MAKKKKSQQDKPHKGDRVAWRSHGSEAVGKVEEEITEREEVAGRTVAASPDQPQYKVRSEKSGRSAVHKPQALEPKPRKEGKGASRRQQGQQSGSHHKSGGKRQG